MEIPHLGTYNINELFELFDCDVYFHKNLTTCWTANYWTYYWIIEHFFKHCYSIKNRWNNIKLANNFPKSHNINDNLNVTILKYNVRTEATLRYYEDNWFCTLKSPDCLNTRVDDYAKEMCSIYAFNCKRSKFRCHFLMMIKKMTDLGLN